MMLLFIGGAARTGKSILVRRLLVEKHMPYLSIDVLVMGLVRGVPEFEIDHNAGSLVVGERIWSLIYEMCRSILHDKVDYAFEGELLPKHVAALQQAHPARVKACFLGYATIEPEQKLKEIRTHAGFPNDWSSEMADADLLKIIHREIAFSRYLKAECGAHNLPYFDTSHNFTQTLDEVVAYIFTK
jgi:hypothetical protein